MDATVEFEDVSHTDYARGLMKDLLIGKIDANTLPEMQKKFTKHEYDASSSNDSSSRLLLYAAPLFILVFAFLLRYYNSN